VESKSGNAWGTFATRETAVGAAGEWGSQNPRYRPFHVVNRDTGEVIELTVEPSDTDAGREALE
jgi:hypothetical protein